MSSIPRPLPMRRPPPRRRLPVCIPVNRIKPVFKPMCALDIMPGTCWWTRVVYCGERKVNYKEKARRRKRNKMARRSRQRQRHGS